MLSRCGLHSSRSPSVTIHSHLHRARRVGASTPRGSICNQRRRRRRLRLLPASTLEGFICNAEPPRAQSAESSLQPHEGPSVTRSRARSWRSSSRLQPHGSPSVTGHDGMAEDHDRRASTPRWSICNVRTPHRPARPRPGFNPTTVHLNAYTAGSEGNVFIVLQPYEGSPVTRGQIGTRLVKDASTPRGSICNESSATVGLVGRSASTPRGSICNPAFRAAVLLEPAASTPRGSICNWANGTSPSTRSRSFNPTRVHL